METKYLQCLVRTFYLFSIFALCFSSQIQAETKDPAILSALEILQSKHGVKVIWHSDQQRVRTLDGVLSGPYLGTPNEAATHFLQENRKIFQLKPDLSDINIERTRDTGAGGKKVEFLQSYEGLPVFDGHIDISLRSDNSIDLVHNYYQPALTLSTQPSLSETRVSDIAQSDFVEHCVKRESKREPPKSCQGEPITLKETPHPQLGIFDRKLAYRLTLNIESPQALFEYTIDANTGQILDKIDRIQDVIGSGKVFDPNPVVSLYRYGITPSDNNDKNSPAFANAYTTRNLNDITWQVIKNKNYFYLTGPYVDVTDALESPYYFSGTSGRISVGDGTFNFTRDKNEFEHVMVYYHIDTNQRYIQSLGFLNAYNRQIKVDPHGLNGLDDSHYFSSTPGSGYLAFGEGGVDDAEDADIILHEYGHAIQDSQRPGVYAGCGTESGAMAEGFGDY